MKTTLIFLGLFPLLSLAQVGKPILWDATKTNTEIQNAVSASKAATTATATSYTLPAGTTPTASVSLNNGNFAFTFGLPVSSPVTSSTPASGTTSSAVTALLVDGLNSSGQPLSEGATTLTDRSAGNRTVTASGGAKATLLQNKYGGASIEFTGGNPVVVVAETAPTALTFGTGAIDIDIWIRPTAFGDANTSPVLICRTNSSDPQWVINMKPQGAGTGFAIWNASGNPVDAVVTTFQFSLNTWYNVTVTREAGSSTMRLFVDGILRGVGTSVGSLEQRNIATPSVVLSGYTTGGGGNYSGFEQLKISRGLQPAHQTTSTTIGQSIFTPITPFTP